MYMLKSIFLLKIELKKKQEKSEPWISMCFRLYYRNMVCLLEG